MSSLKQIADDANVSILTAYHALRGQPSVDADTKANVQTIAHAHHYTLNITIRDVAALADVSVGTVSHVLNDSPLTKPETRLRVLQAIKDLDYRRNSIARGLKSNQSRLIGYAWHSADDPIRRNALLDRFLYDIAQAAESWGYHIVTFAQNRSDSVRVYEELVQTARVDGFIVSDLNYNDARIDYLLTTDIPFVAFGHTSNADAYPWVEVNGQLGMQLTIEHLLSRGHQRIALLCWPPGLRIGDERLQGYRDAMHNAGIEPPAEWIGWTRNTVDDALVAARQVLTVSPRPTAIACTNDVMAFGVMRYLEQVGLRIGIDVAVTGFDDTPVAELLQLTSVRQPLSQVASQSIEMLINRIQSIPLARRTMTFDPAVVVRASSRNQFQNPPRK